MKLSSYIGRFRKCRVVVLGDMMLDRYIFGRATRISQEAPVPVVHVHGEKAVPGGAANVARNVLSLGGNVEVAGVTGKDLNGENLKSLLAGAGAGVKGLFACPKRPTTVKIRLLAGNQQVVRIDYEELTRIASHEQKKLQAFVEREVASPEAGALILEDYAKGVFDRAFMQKMVDFARKNGKIVALDPHPKGDYPVQNLTFMTPNRLEAFALAGMEDPSREEDPKEDEALRKVADKLLKEWRLDYLLITLGADGMALFLPRGKMVHIPTEARQVFDVSGAGDTVMATMVLSLLAGASPENAARIANSAAGVVVGRVGTSAIEADVLRGVLDAQSHQSFA